MNAPLYPLEFTEILPRTVRQVRFDVDAIVSVGARRLTEKGYHFECERLSDGNLALEVCGEDGAGTPVSLAMEIARGDGAGIRWRIRRLVNNAIESLRKMSRPGDTPVTNPEPTSGNLVLEHEIGPYVARFYEHDDERERVFQLWRDGVQVLDSEWSRGCAETSSGEADVVNILDDGNLTARETDELLTELVKATGADTFSPRCW